MSVTLVERPVNLQSNSQIKVVSDHWRPESEGDGKKRAYDSGNVVDRYVWLREQLSVGELQRLASIDETEMVVASLAETEQVEVYPYKLFEFDGRIGSLNVIEGDEGESVWVFRDIVDMLASRVAKFPDDDRSKAVMLGFQNSIVPGLINLNHGETLVYFSPPAEGEKLEGEYGFVYLLTKMTDFKTGADYFDANSIKIDWRGEDYFGALKRMGVYVDRSAYPNDYWAVVDNYKSFEKQSLESILQTVMGGDERIVEGAQAWLTEQLSRYQEVREFVKAQQNLAEVVVGGQVGALREVIEELQMEWIRRKQPEIYEDIQEQIRVYGYAQYLVACGLLEFGQASFMPDLQMGFSAPLLMVMRGFGEENGFACPRPSCGKWISKGSGDKCPHCGYTKQEHTRITGVMCA